jgi:16S rRNA (uracil1498-N3)-methyltransferase
MATFFVHCDAEFQPLVPQEISHREAHHLCRVLRATERDRLILFDGKGRLAGARLLPRVKDAVTLLPQWVRETKRTGPALHLLQGLCKPAAMDRIVRQATELGVAEIHPILCQFSQPHGDPRQLMERVDRWNTIGGEACKQSKNPFFPKIHRPRELAHVLRDHLPPSLALVASLLGETCHWPEFRRRHLDRFPGSGEIYLAVGPEGDFSAGEYAMLTEKNFLGIQLGPCTLPSETAAIALLAALQLELDRGERHGEICHL